MFFSILFWHVRKMLYLCTLNAPRALCARIYTWEGSHFRENPLKEKGNTLNGLFSKV